MMKIVFDIFGVIFLLKLLLNCLFALSLDWSSSNQSSGAGRAFALPPPIEVVPLLICVGIALFDKSAPRIGGAGTVLLYGLVACAASYAILFMGISFLGWFHHRK